ncbi:hypothetical protein [Tropicimonas isoalkanivorans]|uniref:Hemolysin-type calcium-binding repeat-containing protein n=1 Tax=Tropicimonas isoalkanivorans TaxID=441112 RepID=A0A1I1D5Y2_9RHOB|nr:hypothetical protein [Tropicimonas isoalkanivorans]SFB70325.1 Hemolysin-type calcium-binding repeat-containing protein [Tropicimonas isoalkanivorans]
MATDSTERVQDLIADSLAAINGDGPNSLKNLVERGIIGGPSVDAESLAAPAGTYAGSGVFNIYVEQGLLADISVSLGQYADDLEAEGYSVRIVEYAGDADNLRYDLQYHWMTTGLEGALLVGDLPFRTFASYDSWDNREVLVEYPHDLYLMDLDGEYNFFSTGADAHLDGTGDVGPEIYLSRITASQLGSLTDKSEADLINAYFDKLHAARTGALGYEDRAIWFADDDWSGFVNDVLSLSGLYDDVTDIRDTALTTEAVYTSLIQENVETLVQQIHAWSSGLSISGIGGGGVSAAELVAFNPQPAFINLFNCSSANYTAASNLAATYTMLSDGVLNTIGSTKTGSMLNFADFYQPQVSGATLGQAFLAWFDMYAAATDAPAEDWALDWFNGMTMHGDPTMGPHLLQALPGIVGTIGDDRLVGTGQSDTIYALAGNDTVIGSLGDDWIDAGSGDDNVRGGEGDDTIVGGPGDDRLSGGLGDDLLAGGADADNLLGGGGNDALVGGAGKDRLVGGADDDVMVGGDATVARLLAGGWDVSGATGDSVKDRFVINAGAGTGDDVIYALESGVDVLRFKQNDIANAAQDGDDVLLSTTLGGSVRVLDVTLEDLALSVVGSDYFDTV